MTDRRQEEEQPAGLASSAPAEEVGPRFSMWRDYGCAAREIPKPSTPRAALTLGLLAAAVGLAGLFILAREAQQWLNEGPWSGKTVLRESPPEPGVDVMPLVSLPLPESALEEGAVSALELSFMQGAQQGMPSARLSLARLWMAGEADTPADALAPLLTTGRLPGPGKPEALAGDLAPGASFTLNGATFEVVGALDRRASLFTRGFLIPFHPSFEGLFPEEETGTEEKGAARVWIADAEPGAAGNAPSLTEAGLVRLPAGWQWAGIASLTALLLGGAGLQVLALKRLAALRIPVLGPSLHALAAHPVLLWASHIVLYGAWVLFMCLAPAAPRFQAAILSFLGGVFTEGHLAYIGEAYTSKNVLLAAWATWVNNYLLQTLGLTFIVSLLAAPWGLLKTLLSFTLLGFAMSPAGANLVQGFTYHSVTMALELEAYVLACFFVGAFWLNLVRAFGAARPSRFLLRSGVMYLSGALLTGVLLAIAALYEAVTLIAAM